MDTAGAASKDGAKQTTFEGVPIFNGKNIETVKKSDTFKYIVHLQITRAGGQTFLCSGSLIAERMVLTAAHCVDGATSVTVYRQKARFAVEYDSVSGQQWFFLPPANEFMRAHPGERLPDEILAENDVALVSLSQSFGSLDPLKVLNFNFRLEGKGRKLVLFGANHDRFMDIVTDGHPLSDRRAWVQSIGISNVRFKLPGVYRYTVNSAKGDQAFDGDESYTCQGDSGGLIAMIGPTKSGDIGLLVVGVMVRAYAEGEFIPPWNPEIRARRGIDSSAPDACITGGGADCGRAACSSEGEFIRINREAADWIARIAERN